MAMRISEEQIEEIRNSNDILDVVSEYIKVDKKGKDYFGLCPFHNEKTPSFSVAQEKQIFYCFGCGKGGNVISFIREIENLDYINAIRFLADRANIILPDTDNEKEIQKEKEKKVLYRLNKTAARIFYNNLLADEGKNALEYLYKRGIKPEIIKKFGLGYAKDSFNSLIDSLQKEGFKKEDLLKTGLALKSKKGSVYQRFRDRIIFPIIDIRGNVIGFGGRITDKEGQPKYMNSPQSIVYDKSANLYGLNLSKKEIDGTIIIVEGYIDVIALYKSGIKNVAATLGTAMTVNHARLIKKYANEVIIAYDMDAAGRKAALRGIKVLEQVGLHIKVLEIEGSKDPDEYIEKNGIDAFKKALKASKSFVEYRIKILKESLSEDSPEERVKFIKGAAKILTSLRSRVEREVYIKKIAEDYGISVDAINHEINLLLSKDTKDSKYTEKKTIRGELENKALKRLYIKEFLILIMTGLDYRLEKKLKKSFKKQDFLPELSELTECVYNIVEEKKEFSMIDFISAVPDKYTGEVTKLLKTYDKKEDLTGFFEEIMVDMEILNAEFKKEDIITRLKDSGISNDEKALLYKEYKQYEDIIKEKKRK
jgi:DNA primase